MGTEQGQEAAGSPPADPSLPSASGGAGTPANPPADPPPQQDPPPAASDGQPGASPAPADTPPKKDEPAANDQLEDALNLLSKPEDRVEPAKGAQPPSQTDGKAPAAKPDEKPPAASQDDAYAGFTEDEKRAIQLKPKTKERIEKLYGRAREAEQRAQALELVKGPANDITEALKAHKAESELGYVQPRQMVALTVAQAAINRVALARQSGSAPAPQDVATAKQFFTNVRAAAKVVGEQIEEGEFTGEIPKDIKDLQEVYGVLDADEAKVLAGHRARKAASPPPQPKGKAPAATVAPPQGEVNPEAIAAQVADQTWIEATLNTLHEDGIEPAKTQAYYEQNLVPRMHKYLAEKVPQADPDVVLSQLTPKAKHQLVVMAHKAERSASTPPPASRQQAPAPRSRPLTGMGTSARIPAPGKGDDHVSSAVDYLARD